MWMDYITGTKTIIFEDVTPYMLKMWIRDFRDVENIIIGKLTIFRLNTEDSKIDNLPISLKSLIIGKILFTYPYEKIKRDEYFEKYCKLPFCCEPIKGKVKNHYNNISHKSYMVFQFKYINNFKDFNFETVLMPYLRSSQSLFIPHTITNKGRYYEILI